MKIGLEGKVVLVTGAANGIGRAIAAAFAEEGSTVVVSDIDIAAGEAVAAALAGVAPAHFLPLDVTDHDATVRLVAEVERLAGPLDVLVNNAGVVGMMPLETITAEEWNRVFAVNVQGVLNCMQAVIPGMKARGGGKIVNLCSQTSKMAGSLDYSHYTASKAAVWNLTMSAAKRYAGVPINVNGVAPGSIVDTDFSRDFGLPMDKETIARSIPMGRRGTPADIAPAVVFLASEGARYITGELIDINGGALMD
jgi:3-oxoacyl-[acyl-carrier protein] reductase